MLRIDKRAQVTVFIIMGIVILFTVSIALFIRSETSKVWVEKLLMPEEVMPIREYVQTCLEEITREGINQIGAKGGFTEIPDVIARNPKARLDIFPEAGMMIPLWYYRGLEYKPNLDEMQKRLARYVEENLQKCTGDFEGFTAMFEIEELSDPAVRVTEKDLAEKDVTAHMIYRLKITSKADKEETKMSLFNAKIPVRLKKVFEVAEQIYRAENEQLFLENQLIDLMSLDEDVVPITYVHIGRCSPLVMTVKELRSNVKGLATFNFPNTVINGTKTKELRDEDWYAKLHQTYDFGMDAEDIAVEFRHDREWPMDFLVSPNQGRYIRAEPMRLFNIIPTCVLQYHFVYDVNFPVLISIIDDEAKDHESFVFNFAMPVVINHNEGDKIPNPRHVRFDAVIPPAEDYCEEYPKSELTIKARNKITYDDLADVNLTYRCTAFECDIGAIKLHRGLTTQVPRCSQAVITGRRDGFMDTEARVDTTKEDVVEIDMTPAETIKFKIIKRRLDNPRVKYTVQDTETAVITMTNPRYGHTAMAVYSPLEPDMAEIELLSQWDYKYNIDIILLDEENIIGGYNANWTVKWRDFIAADELVFNVFEIPEIKTLPEDEAEEKQMEILFNMTEISKKIPEPGFK